MLPELGEPLARLDAGWAQLEAAVGALSPPQREFRPRSGAWNVHELIHHMQLVEEAFLGMMRRSGGRGERRRPWARSIGWAIVRFVLKRGIRVRIPRGAEPMRPSVDVSLETLFDRARGARTAAGEYFETLAPADLSRSAAKHPVGGALDFREAIEFTESHFRHHLRQFERIRSNEGFPG